MINTFLLCFCITHASSNHSSHLIGSNDGTNNIVQRESVIKEIRQQEDNFQNFGFFRPWGDMFITKEDSITFTEEDSKHTFRKNLEIYAPNKKSKGGELVESQKELWTDKTLFEIYPFLREAKSIDFVRDALFSEFKNQKDKTCFQEQVRNNDNLNGPNQENDAGIEYTVDFLNFVIKTVDKNLTILDSSNILGELFRIFYGKIYKYVSFHLNIFISDAEREQKFVKLYVSVFSYLLLNMKGNFTFEFHTFDDIFKGFELSKENEIVGKETIYTLQEIFKMINSRKINLEQLRQHNE